MNFSKAIIQNKEKILDDTYRFLITVDSLFNFSPGQYVFLKNPLFLPEEMHPFSIASSPLQNDILEFCIKVYGDWTENFSHVDKGTVINISQALGNFTWDEDIQNAVFLLGGIGISPIMSILRYLTEKNKRPKSITILYGNRTPETIAYRDELEALGKILPLKFVHIFSHIGDSHPWQGYRGFITKDIIEKEVNLKQEPTFFLVGPPIFIGKMGNILSELSIPSQNIKQESLDKIT